jgi:LysM repeat protein
LGGTSIRVPEGTGDDVQSVLEASYHPKALTKSELRDAARAQRIELRHSPRRSGSKANTHVVRRGETLSEIGARYGRSSRTLAQLNGLGDAGRVRAGQRIRIR